MYLCVPLGLMLPVCYMYICISIGLLLDVSTWCKAWHLIKLFNSGNTEGCNSTFTSIQWIQIKSYSPYRSDKIIHKRHSIKSAWPLKREPRRPQARQFSEVSNKAISLSLPTNYGICLACFLWGEQSLGSTLNAGVDFSPAKSGVGGKFLLSDAQSRA